jgi:chemotaxis family two-component system sensor kinase Cph1
MDKDLASLQAAFDDFLYAAVHDIRGPLGQVRSLAVLLARQHKESLNADGLELCELIETASRRAVEVVESIHAYARVLDLPVFETTDVNAVADGARYALQPLIDVNQAVITRDDLGCIDGDPAKLMLLFQELFRNAIKFRGASPPSIHCAARMEQPENVVLFCISDNGLGIASKESEAIFKPLKRLHGREVGGTGMGLAICRRIVEMHGGKIWLESDSDGGADFRFTLPMRQPAES